MPVNCLWCAANCQRRFNLVENYCALKELHWWQRFRAASTARNGRFVFDLPKTRTAAGTKLPLCVAQGKVTGSKGRWKQWFRLMGLLRDAKGDTCTWLKGRACREAGQVFGVSLGGAGAAFYQCIAMRKEKRHFLATEPKGQTKRDKNLLCVCVMHTCVHC